MKLRLLAVVSVTLFFLGQPADAAPRESAAPSADWIRVPADEARFKLRRFTTKVPPREYRVVVDVPARGRGAATVAKSSGDSAMDEIALEFAAAYATRTDKLRAMHAARSLRFPLVFDLRRDQEEAWRTPSPRGALSLYTSTLARAGNAAIRVTTGPDGRVKTARIIGSLGSNRYDREVEEFVRNNWSGPPNATRILEAP